MAAVGLIVEYNPFHRGHEIHLMKARELAGNGGTVICAMSGSFTQRGEPAMVSKWARAEMALAMGADVVFEIPVPWVVSSAEGFAAGGVSILTSAGCETIFFGSECGSIGELHRIAEVTFSRENELVAHVRKLISSGGSYARGAAAFVEKALDLKNGAVDKPNDVLGAAYLVAARRLGAEVEFMTMRRVGAGYNDETPGEGGIASATGVRRMIASGEMQTAEPYVPVSVWKILSRELETGLGPVFFESLEIPVLYAARISSIADLRRLPRVCPGMDFTIQRACKSACGVKELMETLKNKSVTLARVRRVLCSLLIGIPKEAEKWTRCGVPYLRLLGTSPSGRIHLARIRKRCPLPVIVKVSGWKGTVRDFSKRAVEAGLLPADRAEIERVLALDFRSTDIWRLGVPSRNHRRGGIDFETPPVSLGL